MADIPDARTGSRVGLLVPRKRMRCSESLPVMLSTSVRSSTPFSSPTCKYSAADADESPAGHPQLQGYIVRAVSSLGADSHTNDPCAYTRLTGSTGKAQRWFQAGRNREAEPCMEQGWQLVAQRCLKFPIKAEMQSGNEQTPAQRASEGLR
jgi:hypothetical protein